MARGLEGFPDEVMIHAAFCAARGAPVYASLLQGAVGSAKARERLATAWQKRDFDASYERPLLLCAALRQAALTVPGHPLGTALGETADGKGDVDPRHLEEALEDGSVLAVLRNRFVQTNEVARSVAWQLALSTWPRQPKARVHLADLGCSAGLNLIGDRLGVQWFEGDRPVALDTQAVVVSRTGFDRAPMDVRKEADASWLRACVWPGQHDRLHRLDAAIAEARRSAVETLTCSAGEMPARLTKMTLEHGSDFVLAYSTVFFEYLPPYEKAAFADGMRAWLAAFPGQSLWVELEAGTGEITPDLPAEIRAHSSTVTARLARCDYHSNALADVVRL